jgi:hypothetical protein
MPPAFSLLFGLASDLAAIVLLAQVALNLGVLAATDPQARREVTCSLFGSLVRLRWIRG